MAISLKKNQGLSLKKVKKLDDVRVAIGWDESKIKPPVDIDIQCFILNEFDKVRSDDDMIFYAQTSTPDGTVKHSGDNRTGNGSGDDEFVKIKLSKLDEDIKKLMFTITIYKAPERNHTFGKVENAYARLVDDTNGEVICMLDLDEDAKTATAVYFCELVREDDSWKFNALSKGVNKKLYNIATEYGVNISEDE